MKKIAAKLLAAAKLPVVKLMVVWKSSMFITDGEKHLNNVDGGRNKYWLCLF